MSIFEDLLKGMDEIEEQYPADQLVEEQNEIGETDFGSGYFILNVDKQELYEFFKENMPAGYVHDTFEEFVQNLSVNHFENDELNETGLLYKRDKNFVIEMVDDFIYITSTSNRNFYTSVENEKQLLTRYERFIASKFPEEYKRNLIKRIAERRRHYMAFYGKECRRAYKIYKDNMDALNKNYKEIFDEDCPVFRK